MAILFGPRRCTIPISGAKLLKTGQTTSYVTGDDGDIEAGRDVDFFTLAVNNPFGNTNRFTDELGGSTYTNNIVIDWSTYDGVEVLGYYYDNWAASNWNDAVSWANSLSISTFVSGWRLPNAREAMNVIYFGSSANALNYSPFNLAVSVNVWTGTTAGNNSANALALVQSWQSVAINAKTLTNRQWAARNFTVTGTTLT